MEKTERVLVRGQSKAPTSLKTSRFRVQIINPSSLLGLFIHQRVITCESAQEASILAVPSRVNLLRSDSILGRRSILGVAAAIYGCELSRALEHRLALVATLRKNVESFPQLQLVPLLLRGNVRAPINGSRKNAGFCLQLRLLSLLLRGNVRAHPLMDVRALP
jgi:hypothetical protein